MPSFCPHRQQVHRALTRCRCLALSAGILASQVRADFPALALKPVSLTQIVSPVNIANAGDGSGRLFVCDQAGKIYAIKDGMLLPGVFLDLTAKIVPKAPTSYLFPLSTSYDERGLLGMAFHPNYKKRDINNQPLPGFGRFYVFYSAPSPNAVGNPSPVNCRTTISEFQVSVGDANIADANSERIVLAFDKPQSNHNGGHLEFGPDGFLYISVGDGGSQHDNDYGHTGGQSSFASSSVTGNLGNAQDKTRLYGKILRIDPLGANPGDYGIPNNVTSPADPNPFVGAGGGVREEIFAYGVRNPWKFSFDDGPGGTGRLFEGDVGQDKVEEVNIITKGGNFGWRPKEGTFDHDSTAPNSGLPLIDPIAQYAHVGVSIGTPALPQIGASVIGGYIYRGTAIPALVGKYVFGDYSHAIGNATGTLLGLEETPANSGNWSFNILPLAGGNPLTTRIYAFGRDEQGELYVATKVTRGPFELDSNSKPTGGIYKIVAAQVSTVTVAAAKDNSIYSDFPNNSNALGSLYAGNNASSNPRRALVAFDLTGSMPSGAVVTAATLNLHLNTSASSTPASMSVYKLTQAWGEGTSFASPGGQGASATTGDATWTARLYDATSPTLWTTAGGSFSSTASASTTVGNTATYYSWSSSQMAADVQAWFNSSATNFGWVLLGQETASFTARVFDSREAAAGVRPNLQLSYNPVLPPLSRRESWLQQYFPTPGTYVDDLGDLDGDGVMNLLEYAFAQSPLVANAGPLLQTTLTPSGGNKVFTIVFRRDPRATDLTYRLQTSSDLVTWSTIVQSTAGAAPAGTGFVSETDAPGEAPVKNVTASETLIGVPNRFVRLQVTRVPQ